MSFFYFRASRNFREIPKILNYKVGQLKIFEKKSFFIVKFIFDSLKILIFSDFLGIKSGTLGTIHQIFLGIQTRRTVCIRIADDEVVSNGLCDPDEIPEDISQTCRTNPCPEE